LSNNIKLKRSSTESAVPVPADLILGELAINTFDGKLFLKKNNGSDSIETVVTTDAQITGSVEITGAVTASYFLGDGSALTGIAGAVDGTVSGSIQIDHNTTTNFVANEHIDWTTDQGATNIHSGNYTDTNTTYSVTDGQLSQINFTSADNTKLDGIEALADVTDATNVLANLPSGVISGSTFPFTGDAQITGSLIISGSGNAVFEVIGSSGSLFEINDSFEGTLLSVADISGIPQFGVTSDGVITIGSTPTSLYTTAQIASTQTTTNESVYTMPSSSYDGAWFDYTIISSSNMRAGSIMSIWEAGTANINFTETTTTDIGDTADIVISTVITGSEIALRVNTPTDKWKIKTIVRSI